RRGGRVHRLAQVPGDDVADELPGALDVGQRILGAVGRAVGLAPARREDHTGRLAADGVEEAVGREVHGTRLVQRGDPADRPRHDAGLEGIVRQAVIAGPGVVEHQLLVSLLPGAGPQAAATISPLMARPSAPALTTTVSPSPILPSRIRLAKGFWSSRWMTRFSGRAP